ncbi:uncharacterized protein LOC127565790 [Drosophila albomicans]|uniref:Uncharacterized protein LOC127565790 n=1 Tax=Drosophila albomicans TaxID=7291 RepID=A0A9C6WK01_DROAB|nr:uncharacterized protein LOC127565790 [Drosophila albomicans]
MLRSGEVESDFRLESMTDATLHFNLAEEVGEEPSMQTALRVCKPLMSVLQLNLHKSKTASPPRTRGRVRLRGFGPGTVDSVGQHGCRAEVTQLQLIRLDIAMTI